MKYDILNNLKYKLVSQDRNVKWSKNTITTDIIKIEDFNIFMNTLSNID